MPCTLIWSRIFQVIVKQLDLQCKIVSLPVLVTLSVVLTLKNIKVLGEEQTSVADHKSSFEWHVLSCLQPDCFRGQKLFINLIPLVLSEK